MPFEYYLSFCSDRYFDPRFTMCRVTEKDIKTFCTQDPSLHL